VYSFRPVCSSIGHTKLSTYQAIKVDLAEEQRPTYAA
jgi:hypothetical protein